MANQKEQRYISIMNMTNLFTRDLKMYSLGDIRFNTPISLKKVAYTTGFLLLWTIPLVLIFGLQLNVYFAAIALLPPFVFGHFASKPVWGGKSLVDYIQTVASYITEPSSWTDLYENREKKNQYYVQSEIWISRRRELQLLADLKEKRAAETISQRGLNKNKSKSKKQSISNK